MTTYSRLQDAMLALDEAISSVRKERAGVDRNQILALLEAAWLRVDEAIAIAKSQKSEAEIDEL